MGKVRKAIAGIVSSALTLLVAYNVLPDGLANGETLAAVTSAVTGVIVYFIPNDEA